jgi:membrane-associated protease RseP (regulator of RpoE activity)
MLSRSSWRHLAGWLLASASLVGSASAQFAPIDNRPVNLPAGAPDPIVSSRQEHARLGVTLSDNSQGKVWIKAVEPESGADEAGLRPNDQIVALDDTRINTYLDVVRYINQKGASDDVAVYIRRNGRPGMLTAALGSEYARPSGGQVSEYPGNVRQRSYSAPAPPTVPQRPPGYVVPNTRGPYVR